MVAYIPPPKGSGFYALSYKTPYELVNLSKKPIYLKTPDIANINTNYYFANAPVTIIIDEINSKKS